MENYKEQFEARGVRIVALSVDTPEDTLDLIKRRKLSYTILCDTERKVIRQYDLVHENGDMQGNQIARPAEFLIDPTGTIRWVNLAENWRIRLRPENFLKALDELGVTPS